MRLDLTKWWNWKPSKRDKDPFAGDVKIGQHSSFRKLARAIRRGKVPQERQFAIDQAMKNARRRWGL
jgi:hypothetical protein